MYNLMRVMKITMSKWLYEGNQNEEPTTDTIYVVKKNDTLSAITKKYRTTYQELAKYNNIANSDIINVG